MKILIIRFSSIGDIVLTTPVIRAVKSQLDCELHYATKRQFRSILETNPYLDKVHLLGESLRDLIKILRAERYDFVIDLHNNLRTRLVKFALNTKSASVDKLNIEKWLIVNFKIDRLPRIHIVDRYLKAAAPLGVKNDTLGLDYFIPDDSAIDVSSLPAPHRGGYVAYAIGGQHATKRLPVDRIIELCKNINKPIILLGGKEDFETGEQIRKYFADFPGGPHVHNASGQYSLNQSASIVKQADYVFSHDTGLMHIAAAFRRQVFAIWGNTIPAFGMYPYATRFTSIENNSLSCRPCSKIGFDACPKGHFKCMRESRFDFKLPQ